MTTERRGSRATWLSLAVAGPLASAVFAASLAWASIVTPKTEAATQSAPTATAGTPKPSPAGAKQKTAPKTTTRPAPVTHAKTGASR